MKTIELLNPGWVKKEIRRQETRYQRQNGAKGRLVGKGEQEGIVKWKWADINILSGGVLFLKGINTPVKIVERRVVIYMHIT
ncbi:MAG: hypothetical protein UY48_C0051G0006 [Candidatus Gottesmanbacteria bacterium GW2011_GWB1_49_7]|uniref:Uncharacterized protein n=1 Tax=Candidatus Gottesmanbacteria bacterium GW2011_GWB1_49_7 TaxID=1618448 RepID=A0A0G1YU47_9BACT|nr:MAG: hypothetical protein UY48_C0051G0006 [Candidatus Gottesmanbacteria bacterium GW2011_GWB1_49_7]